MDSFEAFCFKKGRDNPRKSYTFVPYPQDFAPETIEAFLREHTGEFDAVAVSSFYRYDPAGQAMERAYVGPKILIRDKPQDKKPDIPYEFTVDLFVHPADFDRLVEEHFANL